MDNKGFENRLTKWCFKHRFYWEHSIVWNTAEEEPPQGYYVFDTQGKAIMSGTQKDISKILRMLL